MAKPALVQAGFVVLSRVALAQVGGKLGQRADGNCGQGGVIGPGVGDEDRPPLRGCRAPEREAKQLVASIRLAPERARSAREVTADPEPLEAEADDRLGPRRDEREPVAVERQAPKGRLDILA